jgi:N-acetylglucosamine-6-phosphate deacetylase
MPDAAMSHVLGRHYRHGRPVKVDIAAERIREVREVELSAGEAAQLPWLAPGFIDVQSNGYGGQEFSSPDLTAEKVAEITARQSAFGVTQYCPTVTTASRETFLSALAGGGTCGRWYSRRRPLHFSGRRAARRASAGTLSAARLG